MSIALENAARGTPARRATGLADGEAGVDEEIVAPEASGMIRSLAWLDRLATTWTPPSRALKES
jgi:hypothetical protein